MFPPHTHTQFYLRSRFSLLLAAFASPGAAVPPRLCQGGPRAVAGCSGAFESVPAPLQHALAPKQPHLSFSSHHAAGHQVFAPGMGV